MKKNKIYILIITLLSCILLLSIFLPTNDNDSGIYSSESVSGDFYGQQLLSASLRNDGLDIEIPQQLMDYLSTQDENADFLYERPLLAVYFSGYSCGICVDFLMDKLNEHFPGLNDNPYILFIASDYDPEKGHNYKNMFHTDSKLNLPIEETLQPFFCILDNGKIRHIFLPEKTLPGYTDTYLKEIKKRYSL